MQGQKAAGLAAPLIDCTAPRLPNPSLARQIRHQHGTCCSPVTLPLPCMPLPPSTMHLLVLPPVKQIQASPDYTNIHTTLTRQALLTCYLALTMHFSTSVTLSLFHLPPFPGPSIRFKPRPTTQTSTPR